MKARPKLVFVDDDESEREAMHQIVEPEYEYFPIPWPLPGRPIEEVIEEHFSGPPDIFVLDLYLPPGDGSGREHVAPDQLVAQQAMVLRAIQCLAGLYLNYDGNPKKLLQDTMRCLTEARGVLDAQWQALGQSPDHGVALMQRLRARYPKTPVIFYSRKITPEDVVRVLRAGAVDAIRKGFPRLGSEAREWALFCLARARRLYSSQQAARARDLGLNVNATLLEGHES